MLHKLLMRGELLMNIQVLVATMNQCDYSLLEQMNIHTNAIVVNQCDKNTVEDLEYNYHSVKWLSFYERGVGLSRNNALMRAEADVIMFADDDMIFVDDYDKIVEEAYEKIPKADVIIFDLIYPDNQRKPIKKIEKLSARKCMRFGAARISAKLSSLRINGISFNLCFGGGARFSCGEDSLFLMECIRKGLKIYSYPRVIANLIDRESTWFKSYNDKFFFDKGVLFALLYPNLCNVYAIIHCVKQHKRYSEYGFLASYRQIRKGIRYRKWNL
ncbi:MAG: glycosyltransferase family 2 protein [Ruminococcus sp.]|nr:glycosyltransferase family 2 protein [Ruminococcus sp.]